MDLFLNFLDFFVTFALFLFCIISTIIDNKKHPPIIEKGKFGKKNLEGYSVSVWTNGKHSFYDRCDFVKRNNGKYRLRFKPVLEWISGGAALSFYIEMIREFPDNGNAFF